MPGRSRNCRRTSSTIDDGGAADRGHAHGAEQIRQQPAEQQAGDDVGIVQREIRRDALEIRMLRRAGDEEFQVFVIGREQHQGAEAGRTDGIALGHRLGGVADGIERVGRFAHLFRQSGHLGDAAGIVGDRTEGVERDHDAGQRQHGRHRDGDAEQAGEIIADQNAGDDDQRRQRGRFQRHREALDDVGAVAGHRGLRDRAHRAIIGAGVVLGDPDDQAGHRETDDAADEQRLPRVTRRPAADRSRSARRSRRRCR